MPHSTERPVTCTDLDLPGKRSGKVRDVYDLPPDSMGPRLLIIATDRISAFDVVMPTPLAGKGVILTELSTFWLRMIAEKGLARTHLISSEIAGIPDEAFRGSGLKPSDLEGRSTIARKCRVIPIECVVRGYLEGSGWKEYHESGAVCGVQLPSGLRQCDRLPEPIFTPATKEEFGKHDENVTFDRAAELVGRRVLETLRDTSIRIYLAASEHAAARGILIADTKFEFGIPLGTDGEPTDSSPMLVDEALTPDSSRFWPADQYEPGRPQKSFDKQFLREYLETLVDSGTWNKQSPGPQLPAEVVRGTIGRYRAALEALKRS
ncbi:MAG: phosphoribosylaminoimidazolesuccinocarboxamide synthase [Phycisphaeraceae bacterium]|nr:phosphoribosylaminoimidazolesuccinocarboxamide synthase [Phycisphaeraceae bacterium]